MENFSIENYQDNQQFNGESTHYYITIDELSNRKL